MATVKIKWPLEGTPPIFTSDDPAVTQIQQWAPNLASSQMVFTYQAGTGTNDFTEPVEFPGYSQGYVSVYTNRTSADFAGGYYISAKLAVPNGFVPTSMFFYATRANNNNNGGQIAFSNDGFTQRTNINRSNSASTWTKNTITPPSTPVTNGVLEIRIATFSVSFSSANRFMLDTMMLTGTYTPGYQWSVWNGTNEVSATVQGVWNGTTVVPRQTEERVP